MSQKLNDPTRKATGTASQNGKASGAKKASASDWDTEKTKTTGGRRPAQVTAGKSGGGKSSGVPKKTTVTEVPRSESTVHQILPYIYIVGALFLSACYLFRDSAGKVGVLGRGINQAFTGLLGWPAFLIPLILLNLAIFWRRYVDLHLVGPKLTLSGLSILFSSALVQVVRDRSLGAAVYAPKQLWAAGNALTGGGVLGGWLGSLCWQFVGFVGSMIVLIPLLVVLLMFLFGITPRYLWSRCRFLWRARAEERARRREETKAAEAERLAREEQEYYAARMKAQQKAAEKAAEKEAQKAEAQQKATEKEAADRIRAEQLAAEKAEKKAKRKNAFLEMDEIRQSDAPSEGSRLDFGKEDDLDDLLPDAGSSAAAYGYKPPELVLQPAEQEKKPEPEKKGKKTAPINPLADDLVLTPSEPEQAAEEKADKAPVIPLPAPEKRPAQTLTVETGTVGETEDKVDLQSLVDAHRRRPVNPLVEDLKKENEYYDVDDLLAGVVANKGSAEDKTGDAPELELRPIPDEAAPQASAAAGDDADDEIPQKGTETPKKTAPAVPKAGASVMSAATGVKTDAWGGAEEEEDEPEREYVFPPIDYLAKDTSPKNEDVTEELQENAKRLVQTLGEFNVRIKAITYSRGPTITRYELQPDAGIRVRSIANLVDDISLSLATSGVRIEAPIPNKPAVGVEVPNRNRATVYLRELIDSEQFRGDKSSVAACLGMDVAGKPVYFDVSKMPHLLIAGATGMGKSVCINSIIVSILYRAKPEDVSLLLIDPKKVEFNIYRDIPLLAAPIVVDAKRAAGALSAAVAEMERRFELIEMTGVRKIKDYNEITRGDPEKEHLPLMVIVIDELAELMMMARDQVETSICRIAQKGRAAGMHLIIGTQRPSVDVITGVLKANIPSRIACTVASQVDSRTIIDVAGAEKLIGQGDMLFAPVGAAKPQRVQGAYVSETEVENIVNYLRDNNAKVKYNRKFIELMETEVARAEAANRKGDSADDEGIGGDGGDSVFKQAVGIAIDSEKVSTSLLQRKLKIGYGRAAGIIDQMEELGYVSAPDGNKPRRILISREEFEQKCANGDLE